MHITYRLVAMAGAALGALILSTMAIFFVGGWQPAVVWNKTIVVVGAGSFGATWGSLDDGKNAFLWMKDADATSDGSPFADGVPAPPPEQGPGPNGPQNAPGPWAQAQPAQPAQP